MVEELLSPNTRPDSALEELVVDNDVSRFQEAFPDLTDIYGYSFESVLPQGGQGCSVVVSRDEERYVMKFTSKRNGESEKEWQKRRARIIEGSEILSSLHYDFLPDQHEVYSGNNWVMTIRDWVDGITLKDQMQQKNFTEQEAVRYGVSLLGMLNLLHNGKGHRPIVHGDIKPSNIVIDEDGKLKIIDFDLARYIVDDNTTVTSLGGSSVYQGKERFGGTLDPRSDTYSVGVVMFEMIVGEVPRIISTRNYTNETYELPKRISPRLRRELTSMIAVDYEERPLDEERLALQLDSSIKGFWKYNLARLGFGEVEEEVSLVGVQDTALEKVEKHVVIEYVNSSWQGLKEFYSGLFIFRKNRDYSILVAGMDNFIDEDLRGLTIGTNNHITGDARYLVIGGINTINGSLVGVGLAYLDNDIDGNLSGGVLSCSNSVDGNMSGVSVGFTNKVNDLRGAGIGVLANEVSGDLKGLGLGILNNFHGNLVGCGVSIANIVRKKFRGVGISGIFNMVDQGLYGVSVSGFANVVDQGFYGVGLSGLVNYVKGDMQGLGLSAVNYVTGSMTGAELAVGNYVKGDAQYVVVGGLNRIDGKLTGLGIGGLNLIDGDARYLILGGLNHFGSDLEGITLGIVNAIGGDVRGLCVAGIKNEVDNDITGVMVGGLNGVSRYMRGLMLGLKNEVASYLLGCSLGFFNAVGKQYGVSVGLFNVVDDGGKYLQIGLVNANKSRPWYFGGFTPLIGFGWDKDPDETRKPQRRMRSRDLNVLT